VPAIRPLVKRLYVFQREPGWVMPKGERDFTDDERAAFDKPWRRRRERWRQRYLLEKNLWGGSVNRVGTKANAAREAFCRAYIARQFAERPDLAAAVTPAYPYPGKRPVLASTFYPALKKDNVELVPRAVSSVTTSGIVDTDGVERRVDIIVLATGFRPADYLARLRIVGKGGLTLQDFWAGEPHAYLGITVPGFPNFFMLYGPGTNGGEIVMMLESQAEYAVRAIKRMIREGVTAIEVRPRFEAAWNQWLQSKMEGTSWALTNNYFRSSSGKVVTQWPYGNVVYRVLTKALGRVSETSRRRSR
jgi:cation diffusion facilitator CzcD-associated flavoprotein CzcO